MKRSELKQLIQECLMEEGRAGDLDSIAKVPGYVIKQLADSYGESFDPMTSVVSDVKVGDNWSSAVDYISNYVKDGSGKYGGKGQFVTVYSDEEANVFEGIVQPQGSKGFNIVDKTGQVIEVPTIAGVKKWATKIGAKSIRTINFKTWRAFKDRESQAPRSDIARDRRPSSYETTDIEQAKIRAWSKFIDKRMNDMDGTIIAGILDFITANQADIVDRVKRGYSSIDIRDALSERNWETGEFTQGIKDRNTVQQEKSLQLGNARRRARGEEERKW